MPRTLEVLSASPEPDDVPYLFAQDALAASLRYLFADDDAQRIEVLRAIAAVDVAWEVAPASDRRRVVLEVESFDTCLALPAEQWLPRAKELGVRGTRLIDDGQPSVESRLLAKDLLPYLFRPALQSA